MTSESEINAFIDKLKDRGEPCIVAMFTADGDSNGYFRVSIPYGEYYLSDLDMMSDACDKMKKIIEEEITKFKEGREHE